MSSIRKAVGLYRVFYRSPKFSEASSNKSNQPVRIVLSILEREPAEILRSLKTSESAKADLKIRIGSQIHKLMNRIRFGGASGQSLLNFEEQKTAINDFVDFMIDEVFINDYKGEIAFFSGKQAGLFLDGCEFTYKCLQDDSARNLYR